MKFRTKVLSLSAAIIILAGTYFLGGVFSAQNTVDKLSMEPMFDQTLKETLSGVKVSTTAGNLMLEKKGKDEWVVRIDENVTYPASGVRIESLVTSVFDVTKFRLVGRGDDNLEQFELEDNRADTVEVFADGKSKFILYVGKEGPGRKGDYVRSTLSDEIYLTDATMQRHFGQDPKYWFNMRLFPEKYIGEDMFAINISDISGNKISIKKDRPDKKGQWENLIDKSQVPVKFGADTIANKLAMLEAEDFVNGDQDFNANAVIEIDSAEYGHMIFDCRRIVDGENYKYVVRKRGDTFMYLISEENMLPILFPKDLYKAE